MSRVSNIESDNSHYVGLEDYNSISDKVTFYYPIYKDMFRVEGF